MSDAEEAPRYELFSKRRIADQRAGLPVIYEYDALPKPFRQQVLYIWERLLGKVVTRDGRGGHEDTDYWAFIHNHIAEEHGIPFLGDGDGRKYLGTRCKEALLTAEADLALDLIELSFRITDVIMTAYNADQRKELGITSTPDKAIALLNRRFQEHSLGYQFAGGYLVRMDSAFAHAEMVEPAIALLHETAFKGASDEYMAAHKHYRHGENKDAVADRVYDTGAELR